MSEMLERVTRAICQRTYPPSEFSECCGNCGVLVDQARAAIAALREPTEAMVQAVRRAKPHDMDLTEAWPIAIDEALK